MTELNDHLKLLYARAARLYCRSCGQPSRANTPDRYMPTSPSGDNSGRSGLVITFPVTVPKNFSEPEVKELLERQGYTRIHAKREDTLEVIQDRLRFAGAERARVIEALEAALKVGQGRVNVYPVADDDGVILHPSSFILRRGGFPRRCTAPTATSITRNRRPVSSRSIPRSGHAQRAAASGA